MWIVMAEMGWRELNLSHEQRKRVGFKNAEYSWEHDRLVGRHGLEQQENCG